MALTFSVQHTYLQSTVEYIFQCVCVSYGWSLYISSGAYFRGFAQSVYREAVPETINIPRPRQRPLRVDKKAAFSTKILFEIWSLLTVKEYFLWKLSWLGIFLNIPVFWMIMMLSIFMTTTSEWFSKDWDWIYRLVEPLYLVQPRSRVDYNLFLLHGKPMLTMNNHDGIEKLHIK